MESMRICAVKEEADVGMISSNLYLFHYFLFHYFLWGYYV